MAKIIDKVVQQKTTPKDKNVLWDDYDNLKINRNGKWESIGGGVPMLNVKYAELVDLRNNNKLIAGMQYRVTDYVTTTSQEKTLSAGHQFDVIVTADDEKTLNENARAIQHEGDTYFSNSNLAAWELKYCLDNDIARFYWAQEIELSPVSKRKIINIQNDDEGYSYIYLRYPEGDENGKYAWAYDSGGEEVRIKDYINRGEEDFYDDECIYTTTPNPSVGYRIDEYNMVIEVSSTASGKGVIYYMKDEWNNECPYDFKNIMFRNESGYNYYTFNSYNYGDDTIDGNAHNNVIKPHIDINYMRINNIRFGSSCYYNTFGYNCTNNSFGEGCYNNTFGNGCYSNTFGNYCHSNSLGNSCYSNSFDYSCDYNSFGNGCGSNSFGNGCNSNSLGNYCHSNSLGNRCESNSFGNNCGSVKLDKDTCKKTVSANSSGQAKVFSLADLADLLNS